MATKKSLIEVLHDEGYGESLLMHINHAFGSKDMSALRVIDHEAFVTMLAALTRQHENIQRWLATGEPASPGESKEIAEQIEAAIKKANKFTTQ